MHEVLISIPYRLIWRPIPLIHGFVAYGSALKGMVPITDHRIPNRQGRFHYQWDVCLIANVDHYHHQWWRIPLETPRPVIVHHLDQSQMASATHPPLRLAHAPPLWQLVGPFPGLQRTDRHCLQRTP